MQRGLCAQGHALCTHARAHRSVAAVVHVRQECITMHRSVYIDPRLVIAVVASPVREIDVDYKLE
jgi:hypothetical protein